jgi:AcrR family transcriptional regulator
MTSERQGRKLQATIDHIGAVAWRMFEADGFDSVSMESIAVAADVAKGTLYKHFPVKEALIGHRFESDRRAHARKIDAAVMAKTSCAERLTLRLKKEAEYIEKMRRYMAPYLRYRFAAQPASQPVATLGDMEIFITELLAQGQVHGEITPTIPAARLAEYLRVLRLAVLMRWLRTPGAYLNAMNKEMLELFLTGAQTKAEA